MLGDSLVKGLLEKLDRWDISIRCHRGAKVPNFIDLLTTDFDERQWRKVRQLFILIGTNNVQKTTIGEFEKKYTALLKIIRARLGDIPIIACSLLPRPKDFDKLGEKCKEFNFCIKRASCQAACTFYPLHKAFLFDKLPKDTYFTDGLHFSYLGNKVLCKVVKRWYHTLQK